MPGRASGVIPLFQEIRTELDTLFDLAPEGAEFVFDKLRRDAAKSETGWKAINLRTQFTKIIKNAGRTPWPKLWHNLRASRQTELTEEFPTHVVTAWLGNSERIAERHHLQVLDSHFQRATEGAQPSAAQNPAQHSSEEPRNDSQAAEAENEEALVLQGTATKQGLSDSEIWAILDSNQ